MRNYTFYLFIILVVLLTLGISGDVAAQCPMCKMSAESNLKNGGTAGVGLNAGILYMLITPYLLVGTMAYLWWRNKKRTEKEGPVE